MNFNTWFVRLQTRTASNAGAGLPAFKRLLARLDNPQNRYSIIHVAGTNGKGTVCTLLAHTLTCAGHKTGLFVSPHLIFPTERIRVSGQPISVSHFEQVVQTVLAAQEEPLNFFELLTAVALVYFAQQQVQYAVLETGLGGKKDPTNACNPVLSILTSIGLDHTHLLGNTLAQIATQKAGIIKPGVPVFCGDVSASSATVIEQAVLNAPTSLTWVRAGHPFYEYAYDFVNGFTTLHTADRHEWNLHLLGSHQTQNACLVYQAAQRLGIAQHFIQTAFETVQLPGRFERIKQDKTTFILDGAHNPQAVQGLLQFWQKTPYALQNPTLLCGFMKDKDYQQMLPMLLGHFRRVILTVPPSPRAATQADYADVLRLPGVTFAPNLTTALTLARQSSAVLCTGSFYLVGAVRKICLAG